MRTRITTLAVATSAALLLASCGSGDGGGGGDATADLTGEGTGEGCTIDGTVTIGAALSLTGGAATYGESQQKGLQLAASHLAEKGGIDYDLSLEDDATEPRQGIQVFEKFVNGGVSAIIGPTLSNGAVQADPIAQEAGVPVLGISNTAAGITDIGDFVFRDSLTEAAVIPQTVEVAKEAYGLERVVLMYSNDDAFTESGADAFRSALEDNGVAIDEEITFSKSDTDFRALLTQARRHDADALVVSGLIEAAIPLVTQARETGLELPIIGGNGFNNPTLMAEAGEAADGVVVGAAWNSSSDLPENTAFLQAYQDDHGAAPDQFGAQAYAGLMVLDHAIRQGCSAVREDIKEQLNAIEGLPTVLGEFSFDEHRDAVHPAVVQVVEDGSFQVLD